VAPVQPQQRRRDVTGRVYLKARKKGPVWHWKVRLPAGGEERKAIGPAWTGSGRTPDRHFTKRTAQAALDARLAELRRGTGIPTSTGVTFRDAAERWYTRRRDVKKWKPSVRRDYRSLLDHYLIPAFGDWTLDAVTTEAIERWRAEALTDGSIRRRTAKKLVAALDGIFEQARKSYGLSLNPAQNVEQIGISSKPEQHAFYTMEEVHALVRAARNKQFGAIFLTAAFTGSTMGEVLALRLRDVDFAGDAIRISGSSDAVGGVDVPKGSEGRTVPMVTEVAQTLAAHLHRERFTNPGDYVFVDDHGGNLERRVVRRRYRAAQKNAGLKPIRLQDLRHTFGSLESNIGSMVEVQHSLGRVLNAYDRLVSLMREERRRDPGPAKQRDLGLQQVAVALRFVETCLYEYESASRAVGPRARQATSGSARPAYQLVRGDE
jgi:integrase